MLNVHTLRFQVTFLTWIFDVRTTSYKSHLFNRASKYSTSQHINVVEIWVWNTRDGSPLLEGNIFIIICTRITLLTCTSVQKFSKARNVANVFDIFLWRKYLSYKIIRPEKQQYPFVFIGFSRAKRWDLSLTNTFLVSQNVNTQKRLTNMTWDQREHNFPLNFMFCIELKTYIFIFLNAARLRTCKWVWLLFVREKLLIWNFADIYKNTI